MLVIKIGIQSKNVDVMKSISFNSTSLLPVIIVNEITPVEHEKTKGKRFVMIIK